MNKEEVNRKREHILDAALRVFAEKGYHAATMQEISKEAGIAKGSVYSYFESKEQLLVSIFELYTKKIEARLQQFDQEKQFSPLKKLEMQIEYTFRQLAKYRHFVIMHSRGNEVPLSDDLKRVLIRIHLLELTWYQTQIKEIYGRNIEPYTLDLATVVQALIREFLLYFMFAEPPFEPQYKIEQIPTFITRRLEDMAIGMMNRNEPPLMTGEKMKIMIRKYCNRPSSVLSASALIQKLRDKLQQEANVLDDISEAESVLELLEKEWMKKKPRIVMLKSLLACFKALDPSREWTEIRMLERLVEKEQQRQF